MTTKSKAEILSSVTQESTQFLRSVRVRPFDSVANVAVNLRLSLQCLRYLLRIRKAFIERGKELGEQVERYRNNVSGWHSFERREVGAGGWSKSKTERQYTYKLSLQPIRLPNSVSLSQEVATYKKECEFMDIIVPQLQQLAVEGSTVGKTSSKDCNGEDYSTFKRKLPIGGRKAMSILQAYFFGEGKRDNSLATEHQIAGWSYQFNEDGIKRIQKSIIPILEKGGKAPSVKAGRELLLERNNNTVPQYRGLYSQAYSRFTELNYRLEHILLGATSSLASNQGASFLLAWKNADKSLHTRNVKIMYKIMGMTKESSGTYRQHSGETYANNVPTILIGKWYRVGVSDYACRCLAWSNDRGRDNRRIREGIVITRQGWNDVIHCKADRTPEQIVEMLDNGSHYFFNRKRSEEERKKTQRQRIASLLISLRSLPSVTLQDSYSAGNCSPGTSQFCQQLGITDDAISGKELANRWKSKDYLQLDRFAGVVFRAKERIKRDIELEETIKQEVAILQGNVR